MITINETITSIQTHKEVGTTYIAFKFSITFSNNTLNHSEYVLMYDNCNSLLGMCEFPPLESMFENLGITIKQFCKEFDFHFRDIQAHTFYNSRDAFKLMKLIEYLTEY